MDRINLNGGESKRGKIRAGRLAVVVVLAVVAFCFIPSSDACWRHQVMRARTRSWYTLAAEGSDTLYFSALSGDTCLSGLSVLKEDAGREFLSHAFFISYAGRLATAADTMTCPDSIASEVWHPALAHEVKRLDEHIRYNREMLDEMAYYERTHSVVDEGYHQVRAYQERLKSELIDMERLQDCALAVLDGSGGVARLHRVHEVSLSPDDGTSGVDTVYACRRLAENAHGVSVWQVESGMLPSVSERFRPNPFPYTLFHFPDHLYKVWGRPGILSLSEPTDTVGPDMFRMRLCGDSPLLPLPETADGLPVSGRWGCLNGMLVRGRWVSACEVYRLQFGQASWVACVWEDVRAWVRRMWQKTKEAGV